MRYLFITILLIINPTIMSGQVDIKLSISKYPFLGWYLNVSIENKSGSDIMIINESSPGDGNSYMRCVLTGTSSDKKGEKVSIINFIDPEIEGKINIRKKDTMLKVKNNSKWNRIYSLIALGLLRYEQSASYKLTVDVFIKYVNKSEANSVQEKKVFML